MFGLQLNKPPDNLDANLGVHRCTRYNGHLQQPREQTSMTEFSMRTAPDSSLPPSSDLYRYLEEFKKDKQYFDKYIKTESECFLIQM